MRIGRIGPVSRQAQARNDYSLRHTAIMMRIINGGVETLALAKNARTSQQMIEQFYAAHLTTDQVRKQLHAFTGTPAKPKTKAKASAPHKKTAARAK